MLKMRILVYTWWSGYHLGQFPSPVWLKASILVRGVQLRVVLGWYLCANGVCLMLPPRHSFLPSLIPVCLAHRLSRPITGVHVPLDWLCVYCSCRPTGPTILGLGTRRHLRCGRGVSDVRVQRVVKLLFWLIFEFTAVGDGNIHLFINRGWRSGCGGRGEHCGCGRGANKLFYTVYWVVEATLNPA